MVVLALIPIPSLGMVPMMEGAPDGLRGTFAVGRASARGGRRRRVKKGPFLETL